MINKEKFDAYVKVQMSGKTNMWDVNTVCRLSRFKLTRDDCLDIMKNYSKYKIDFSKDNFGGVF